MAGRRIEDGADAQRCLDAAEASGLTRRDWAVANGVDARSLNLWRLNLKRRAAREQPEVRFVELVPSSLSVSSQARRGRYLLHVGRVSIEVDDGFDVVGLTRLLQVVSVCSA